MTYYVIELQDGAALWQAFTQAEYENGTAVSNFHSRCSSAAISSVAVHTIMFVDEEGRNMKRPETFRHGDDE